MRRGLLLAAALLAVPAACAYFNSLYNAERLFREAETARRRGREAEAHRRYRESLEKAAKSLRIDGDGRWADDALFVVGRAHFELGNLPEARAALLRARERSGDEDFGARVQAYLGAVELREGRWDEALPLLDSALLRLPGGELRARALLWRAEARFAAGDADGAWADLDRAAAVSGEGALAVALTRLSRGVAAGELDRAREATGVLFRLPEARFWGDSIRRAAATAARAWGPEAALALLEGVEGARWPPEERDRLLLVRARHRAEAGDTAGARRDAGAVAGGAGRLADEARVLLARWRLAEVERVEELEEVRGMLLPAIGSREARRLLDAIKKVGIYVERARDLGQRIALFNAAELARDTLGSPALARELFLVYGEEGRESPWRGKALLAALDLAPDPARAEAIRRTLDSLDDVYAAVARGETGREREFEVVEQRLDGVLQALRRQAEAEAKERDVVVLRAARLLDTLRAREAREEALRRARVDSAVADSLRRADSARVADSLRADSLRADSLRADSLRLDSLGIDSLFQRLLRDTTGATGPAVPFR